MLRKFLVELLLSATDKPAGPLPTRNDLNLALRHAEIVNGSLYMYHKAIMARFRHRKRALYLLYKVQDTLYKQHGGQPPEYLILELNRRGLHRLRRKYGIARAKVAERWTDWSKVDRDFWGLRAFLENESY